LSRSIYTGLSAGQAGLADLTNTASVSYQDSSGNTGTATSNTVTVVVSAGALPAPVLSLPSVLPVNAQIHASEPSGYVITAYNWTVIPQTTSSGSPAPFQVSYSERPARTFRQRAGWPIWTANLNLANIS